MSRRLSAFVAVLLAAVLMAACGSHPHAAPAAKPLPPSVVNACPQATDHKGSMGECAPAASVTPLVSTRVHASSVSGAGGITWPDFSNNVPCYCAGTLKTHGHPGEVDKVNQGVGFVDGTFGRM